MKFDGNIGLCNHCGGRKFRLSPNQEDGVEAYCDNCGKLNGVFLFDDKTGEAKFFGAFSQDNQVVLTLMVPPEEPEES
jgi:hypothetical protein